MRPHQQQVITTPLCQVLLFITLFESIFSSKDWPFLTSHLPCMPVSISFCSRGWKSACELNSSKLPFLRKLYAVSLWWPPVFSGTGCAVSSSKELYFLISLASCARNLFLSSSCFFDALLLSSASTEGCHCSDFWVRFPDESKFSAAGWNLVAALTLPSVPGFPGRSPYSGARAEAIAEIDVATAVDRGAIFPLSFCTYEEKNQTQKTQIGLTSSEIINYKNQPNHISPSKVCFHVNIALYQYRLETDKESNNAPVICLQMGYSTKGKNNCMWTATSLVTRGVCGTCNTMSAGLRTCSTGGRH